MIYIVATPIGNMKDITLRAIEVLSEVDYVLAEDTRVAGKLLKYHSIENKKFMRFDEFAGEDTLLKVKDIIDSGLKVAYISDAGTPGISDPGAVLVDFAFKNDIIVIPIGGISALTTAMSVSGIRGSEFLFYGFLPHKNGRGKILTNLLSLDKTIVLYESPHRFLKLLSELIERGVLHIVVCRELTKLFEEIKRCSPSDMLDYYTKHKDKLKGEFVIVIDTERAF
jgi:16S rRNA (cytidine1402-2'-O)-methyltransferase